jgi:FKBP-type peptidyl-prolyl cis-trans isomerase (trigger factor)
MKTKDNKYDRVLNFLRNSKPDLKNVDVITEKVMRQLQEEKSKITFTELLLDFFFGWVYIGWVRKSMVTAVLAIAVLFIYQNAQIIRQMKDLSGQRIQNGSVVMTNLRDNLIDQLRIFKLTGKSISDEKITVSEKEIDEMIRSLNKLQVKYKDVINLIENDPELKKYVESRMLEYRKNKI